MAIYLLIVLSLVSIGFRISKNGFFETYLNRDQCNAVKGLFILFVFLSHGLSYIESSGYSFDRLVDRIPLRVCWDLGQLMVVMFLFYSGYGVMYSLMNRKQQYLSNYPRRRLFTTLLNFDVAVCFFILLDWVIGDPPPISKVLLSLIAWESVGNSNWYIFVILFCYLVFFICAKVINDRRWLVVAVSICVFGGMITLRYFKEAWWYNTMLCFPFGVFYASYKKGIETLVQRHYFPILLFVILLFVVFHHSHFPSLRGLTHNIKSILFCSMLVLLTMKIQIGNKWLYWLGVNLFPLYIYQRLPMIALYEISDGAFIKSYPCLFLFISFVLTVAIAFLYRGWVRAFSTNH